jgi:hypothetical protein
MWEEVRGLVSAEHPGWNSEIRIIAWPPYMPGSVDLYNAGVRGEREMCALAVFFGMLQTGCVLGEVWRGGEKGEDEEGGREQARTYLHSLDSRLNRDRGESAGLRLSYLGVVC